MALFATQTLPQSATKDVAMADSNAAVPDQGRYPKRKRAEVKYLSPDSEDDWLSEDEGEYTAQPQKKTKTVPKKLPKHKIFPFMQLPAELRNKVYGYALSAEGGVFVTSKSKGYRRLAQRCIGSECEPQFNTRWQRYYQNQKNNDEEEQEPQERSAFVPNLLAVCKTIHAEAGSVLYSQPITVADNYALLAFLNQIRAKHVRMLRHVTIMQWCGGRAHKSINFPAIAMLSSATELRRLSIACKVGYFSTYSWGNGKKQEIAHRVARKIFRDCYPFLEAYGSVKGDPVAGVDLIEIDDSNFSDSAAAMEPQMQSFRDELRRLLRT
jgi:hypothetical protein